MTECEHGRRRDDGHHLGVWAAPFSECRCCGVVFLYLDTVMTTDLCGWSRTWTKDRCQECGGHYVERRWSGQAPTGAAS